MGDLRLIPVREINMLEEKYESSIPPCCVYKTMKAHIEIGLCWGLLHRIEKDKSILGLCDECDTNERSPYFFYRQEDKL